MEKRTIESNWKVYFDPILKNNILFIQFDSIAANNTYKVGLITFLSSAEIIQNGGYMVVIRACEPTTTRTYYNDLSYLIFTKNINVVTELTQEYPISVYPYPFENFLSIKLSVVPIEVDFFLPDGTLVLKALTTDEFPLETTSLQSGFYILQISNGETHFRKKVVKK
jgi:hypothetical protein